MAKQVINIGTTANDGTGDPLRDAFDKANDNFTELYDADAALGTAAAEDVGYFATAAQGAKADGALLVDGSVNMTGDIVMAEQADHGSTPGAGYGYLWTKNTAPSTLIFTDDAGTDTTLGAGGGGDVVDDTSPQLGGDLDVNGNAIVSVTNGDIAITPDGTGSVVLDGLNWPQADGTADQTIVTDGAGNLSFATAGSGGDLVDDTTPQLGGDLDPNDFDILPTAPASDLATVDFIVEGQSAYASATVNQDGGNVNIKLGEHATGGGSAGKFQVLAPDDSVVASFNEDGDLDVSYEGGTIRAGNDSANSLLLGTNGGLIRGYYGTSLRGVINLNSGAGYDIQVFSEIDDAQVNIGKTKRQLLNMATGYTVSQLPSGTVGQIARVTDADTPTVGSTVTGGAAAAAIVWYNGSNWTVIGQ
jgi:hypothetical protein